MRDIETLDQIPECERRALTPVVEKYGFRANDYYLGLIDWTDPNDPIRNLIIPREDEIHEFGCLDASNEASHTVAPGVQHKYPDTALMLCVGVCGGLCRYCFRKRLFMQGNSETVTDFERSIEYVRAHSEITDVLLTGGDPLMLSTPRLAAIVSSLADIPHVRSIRIGSKMPAFNPFRIIDDVELHDMIRDVSSPVVRIYVMCHFDHPRELTQPAIEAVDLLRRLGAICVNQCPVVAGVNDDAAVLNELFQTTAIVGCPQYYVFQGRPTVGNEPYETPLVRSFTLFSEARRGLSGLARRARFCMSHESGKIEIVGLDDERIYARYHRAKNPHDEERMLVFERDEDAYWLDQLRPVSLS